MLININELKNVIKKATLNFSIDCTQLVISKQNIKSKLISSSSDAIVLLNVENNVIPDLKNDDIVTLNFSEPNTNLIPYINLMDDTDDVKVKISDEKIILTQGKQKANIFLCSPQVISIFESDSPRSDIDFFNVFEIDDDFKEQLNKIKKIGSKFNKIYFGVDKKQFYIETSDKQNRFSNGLKIDLNEINFDDMSMCFDFKNITNLFSIIDDTDFKCKFAYVKEQDLGMMYVFNPDESQRFYLMSKKD